MAKVDRNPIHLMKTKATVLRAASDSQLPDGKDQFQAGTFGPGMPSSPTPLGDPLRQGSIEPRLTEYLPGWNYPSIPGQGKLLPFSVLRQLADIVLPARRAIAVRSQEVSIQPWDIVLRPEFHHIADDSVIQKNREALIRFFEQPDPYEGLSFADWIRMAEEEIDVIDALSVYLRPTISPRGGVIQSGLGALNVIDGSLIKPLRDARGGRPQPPAPAYQQHIYGAPRVDMFSPGAAEDDNNDVIKKYTANELIYRPFTRRPFTIYGLSSLETALQEVKLWLDRVRYHQTYFDQSDLPAMFLQVPKEWGPQQIQEYEQAFNRRMAGDPQFRWRVKMIPGGTGIHPVKPVQYDMEFDDHLIRLIAMAFDVTAEELGISPKSGLGGKGWAEESSARQIRLSLRPRLVFFAELFNLVIRQRLGIKELMFQFLDVDQNPIRDQAYADGIYVDKGIKTRGEIREGLGMDTLEAPGVNDLMVTTTQGTLPLAQSIAYGRNIDSTDGSITDTTEGETGRKVQVTSEAGKKVKPKPRSTNTEAVKLAQIQDLNRWEKIIKARGPLIRPFMSDVLSEETKHDIEQLTRFIPAGEDPQEWHESVFKQARDAIMEDSDAI